MTLADTVVYAHNDWWPLIPAFWLMFWVVVVTMFLRRRRHCGPWGRGASGESVLADRFARGEIDKQEYTDRLGVLRAQLKR